MKLDPHPLLDAIAFETTFPRPLAALKTPDEILTRLALPAADVPLQSGDDVRKAVRDLLRHGGFKPTGRNKPASEYLIKAFDQRLLREINVPVDVCNVVSLHSGLPISVIDADKAAGSLAIGIAPPGSEFVFNPTGQVLRLDGLLCLSDEAGYCANAVKDSQRTKTDEKTMHTVSIIWGTSQLPDRTAATFEWYRELLMTCGGSVSRIL